MNRPELIVLGLWIGVALICIVVGAAKSYWRPRRIKQVKNEQALLSTLVDQPNRH